MADLGTLYGASPLDADDGSYYTGPEDTSGVGNSYDFDNPPTDLTHMQTLALTIVASLRDAPGNDTYTINARIQTSGGTPLAAATSGGAYKTIGTPTSQTDATFGPITFDWVDDTATVSDWNSAVISFSFSYTKQAGPDGNAPRIDQAYLTGTYTADLYVDFAIQESGSDSASIDGSVLISGSVAASEYGADEYANIQTADKHYAVVYSSALGPPTAAQIIAGQDSTGSSAVWSGVKHRSTDGTDTFNVTGLSESTGYKASFTTAVASRSGFYSAVTTTGTFTTTSLDDHTVSPNEAAHSHTADSATVYPDISAADATHAHTADNATVAVVNAPVLSLPVYSNVGETTADVGCTVTFP